MEGPGRLIKNFLRRIQDKVESNFAQKRGLIPCGPDGLIRLELSVYDGPTTHLPRGPIGPRTSIAEIHLDSRKLMTIFQGGNAGVKERVRLFRDVVGAFREIALWLQNDPCGREIHAISSMTLLEDEMKHFGFTLTPLPFWPFIGYGLYMQYLSFLYRAEPKKAQASRTRAKSSRKGGIISRYVPKRAWMSREDFLEKYGSRPTT